MTTHRERTLGQARADLVDYRYELRRDWIGEQPPALFVMLNPSVADATRDDPTIRKCVGFAQRWNARGIRVVNLYARRATKPHDLWTSGDPVGAYNDAAIQAALARVGGYCRIVAAWGAHARPDRVEQVRPLLAGHRVWCLGTTKDGHPRHPLMVGYATELVLWQDR